MLNKNNNEIVTISRVTNLSESVMKDCYYIISETLPMLAEEFYYRAIADVNRRQHILFVAETPRMVVGVLKGFVYGNLNDAHAQIDCLCVDRKYRRRGIADSLIKAYEELIQVEYGASYVCLKSSGGAVTFYKNRGFIGNVQYMRKNFSR